jgi:hypothetical protein
MIALAPEALFQRKEDSPYFYLIDILLVEHSILPSKATTIQWIF